MSMMVNNEDGSSDLHTERFRELHELCTARAGELEQASRPNHGSSLAYGMPMADGRGVVVIQKIFEDDGTVSLHHIEAYDSIGRGEPHVKVETFTSNMDEFWGKRAQEMNDRTIIAGGRYYSIADPGASGARGFGGRKFTIRMKATGEVRETTNLWSGGVIPPAWRERIPDNAEFIEQRPRTDGIFA